MRLLDLGSFSQPLIFDSGFSHHSLVSAVCSVCELCPLGRGSASGVGSFMQAEVSFSHQKPFLPGSSLLTIRSLLKINEQNDTDELSGAHFTRKTSFPKFASGWVGCSKTP